jgi:ACS family hexuronate transporter-like MFS transporter
MKEEDSVEGNRRPIGLRSTETIRSIAGRSRGYFLLIVLVAAIPAFLEGFDTNLYTFGAPYIVPHVHGSAAILGVVATGYALGIALFSMVGGFLFDRFSVKYTIILSVAIFALFTCLTGFANSVGTLIASRLLVGVGIGMFQPAIIALLGDIFFETRGRAVSAFAVFFGGGLFVGPYLISPFLHDYQFPFVLSGVVSLIALIVFYLVIPRTYKKVESRHVSFRGILNRNVTVLSISIFLFGITLFGFLGYYSDYLLKSLTLASGEAAAIASMGGLGGFICAFPLGLLADRVGRKYAVSFASLLILIGSVGMFSVGHNVPGLFVLTFAFGAGWGIYVDLVAALGQDSVADESAGTVTGWLLFLFNVGALFGGPIFALALPLGFVPAGLLTLGISSALSFLLTLVTQGIKESNVQAEVATQVNV